MEYLTVHITNKSPTYHSVSVFLLLTNEYRYSVSSDVTSVPVAIFCAVNDALHQILYDATLHLIKLKLFSLLHVHMLLKLYRIVLGHELS